MVEAGAVVDHAVVLGRAFVRSGSRLSRAIVDPGVEVGPNTSVGGSEDGRGGIEVVVDERRHGGDGR